jgi:HEAT repeat protein
MTTLLLLLSALAPDDKAADDALERFKTSYASPSAVNRAVAVSELCRTPHEKTLARVAPLLSGEAKEVREAAARGLGGFGDYRKSVLPILLAGLPANDKEPSVQIAIFDGLGKLDDPAALPTIHRYFEDKDGKVASAALLAAGAIRSVGSIDAILEQMKEVEKLAGQKNTGGGGAPGINIPGGGGNDPQKARAKEVLKAALKAMQLITKEKWTTSQEWQIWWGKRKATFKIED